MILPETFIEVPEAITNDVIILTAITNNYAIGNAARTALISLQNWVRAVRLNHNTPIDEESKESE